MLTTAQRGARTISSALRFHGCVRQAARRYDLGIDVRHGPFPMRRDAPDLSVYQCIWLMIGKRRRDRAQIRYRGDKLRVPNRGAASGPELAKALHHAKVTGATLVIAKLDRLSRNAAFLLQLQESGAKFVAADMPEASNLTVGILALVAQRRACGSDGLALPFL